MTRLRVLLARLIEQLRRRRVERDLDEELRGHVDRLIDDGLRRGLSPQTARTEALRAIGGIDQIKEAVRDRRGFRGLATVTHDIRYAVRLLRKSPGFTIAAVVTLALGIGANTAIFSLVDAAMLKPLPYAQPGALVSVWESSGTTPRVVVAPANYVDYRRATHAAAMGAFATIPATLTGLGDPVMLRGEEVTGSYFDVLGIAPAVGRHLRAGDNEAGQEHVVVVSDSFWRERMGAAPDAVGRAITLNDRPYDVVGVMPPGFAGVSSFRSTSPVQFWVPSVFPAELLANRDDHEVDVVARLAAGSTAHQLRDELRGIVLGFAPSENARAGERGVGVTPLRDDVARDVSSLLLFLLGAVTLILLLACINVASLLVVRSIARRREIAVRFALGATRARVAGELVVQCLVLASLGAVAGWGLALLMKNLLITLSPVTIPRLDAVGLDGRVLLFTAGIATLTGLAFSVLPAWQLSRARPIDALAASSRVVAHSGALRSRTVLVVVEVAVSTLLLVGAGLMIRSLATLGRVELGFTTGDVLTAQVLLPTYRYTTPESRLAFFEDVAGRLAARPGVRAVTFANRLPLRGSWTSGVVIDPLDGPPASTMGATSAGFQAVSAGYFSTLDLRLIRGRAIELGDREGTPGVAVVNEAFAPALLGGADPMGRVLRRFPKAPAITIVGVVANMRRHGPAEPIEPEVYVSAYQTSIYPPRLAEIAVKLDRDAHTFVPELRTAVWAVDRDQPIGNVRTLDDMLRATQGQPRFQAFLLVMFAALAFALALVGIYGVVAYVVGQRTAEIGLRLALGAKPAAILRSMVGDALRPVLTGAVIGLTGALLLARTLESFLFQVSPFDPLTYVLATALLVAAAAGASYLAARRAATIDPLTALR